MNEVESLRSIRFGFGGMPLFVVVMIVHSCTFRDRLRSTYDCEVLLLFPSSSGSKLHYEDQRNHPPVPAYYCQHKHRLQGQRPTYFCKKDRSSFCSGWATLPSAFSMIGLFKIGNAPGVFDTTSTSNTSTFFPFPGSV